MRIHAYGCRCERCVNLVKAITAMYKTDEYFFTESELEQLAREEDKEVASERSAEGEA